MRSLKNHLDNKLKSKSFKEKFEEEKELVNISIKLQTLREKKGLSQSDLAKKAHVTQQQLSKIENGVNCNLSTFLKVCHALDLEISIKNRKLSA
ncbi:DNA-binding helix-turn-helix protein [Leptospira yanagawae serovar Saopaulo str. Sao Paulo = ATCC 700523]|uniref:DNA-binding helix-turn-helix protein n=1 Tax=Leptospira yanagawae serovar Saopaulo str. Sao Paulo = ATCC 700523 TaxID=1249483 RepID=A0A5E8HFP6_9LEPT|nr:helix-turn-helix transcriptional regulator [Leptospira yanagawae]EOQ90069.1 DNA-binding helix-turn-helix protein [Leptospira yanagawae serovar Saopaulo str. Sao Paulo = ATCC 700523]EOQ90376.1 DNA-binding helix-turn-helix protein [Leptospira yanagawae serovar Saopaulo str. Sao Paulo = ATCC 700523]